MAQRGSQFSGAQPNMQQLMKQAQQMQEQLVSRARSSRLKSGNTSVRSQGGGGRLYWTPADDDNAASVRLGAGIR